MADRRAGAPAPDRDHTGGRSVTITRRAAGLLDTPYLLHGTPGRLRDILQRRRDQLGISYHVFPSRSMETMAPLVEALAGR